MAGTLITNSIAPDIGTNLYLNATQGAGNVVIGNTTTALATFTSAGALIVSNVVSNLVGNVVGNVIGNIANTNITGNIISSQITSVSNTQITGTVIATQGGTGLTSPGTAGNVLTSSGTAWVSSTPVATSASQLARAWVRFNGTTDPVSIEASYNISSITYVSAGLYTIIFTTAMPSTSYVATGMGEWRNGTSNAGIVTMDRNYPPSTTSLTVSYSGAGGGSSLYYYINVVVFGS
jgi:hypothetical protein